MDTLILRTKLFPPAPLPHLLPRRHLIKRLDHPLPRKLTIISAPAGYGKTTLAVRWLHNKPFAWLSLDAEDNDPTRFLTYVSVALQEQDATTGRAALSLLQSGTAAPLAQIIHTLLNDLAQRSAPLHLALDDYHLIEHEAIHDLLAFVLDHAPPTLHLLITSRMELPFSIARYRVRRQVVELRMGDMRFTAQETAVFLNEQMQLNLQPQEIAALETRTEGWAASLQLAALSLSQQTVTNRGRFIQRFAGSSRYLMDYLVDEILQQQSEPKRRFLTRTAVLRRFNAALCAAVVGDDSQTTSLHDLERANLFLIALDEERGWFRYHDLFADLLRHQLQQREPGVLPQLHGRAADWFSAHGYLDEAIHHALQAPDYERAAALLSTHIENMVVRGDIRAALRSIQQLPPEKRDADLRLRIHYAWVLMFVGRSAECEASLAGLEDLLNPYGWPLAAFTAVLQGYLATRAGDFQAGIAHSRQAYEQLSAVPNPDQTTRIMRGAAAVNLGHSYAFANDPTRALHLSLQAADINMQAGNALAGLAATTIAAQLMVSNGRLLETEKLLKQGLATATAWAETLPGHSQRPLAAAPLLLELGNLYLQWNQVEQAAPYLEEAAKMYRLTGATNEPDGLGGLLELHWARRDTHAIAQALESLHTLAAQSPPDYTRRRLQAAIVTWQTRLLTLGDAWSPLRPAVATWARQQQSLATAPLELMFEFEQLALVRAWLYLGHTDEALALLGRLAAFAAATGRDGDGWRVELLTIQVLAQSGAAADARDRLQALLRRTESAGVIRLYLDEGNRMADLLAQCPATPYRDRLLAAFNADQLPSAPQTQPLVEPLSPRELEVLALLAEGATNQHIADTLVISYATAKKHVSNIIGKLAVGNRTEAAARARTLNLTP